MVILALVFALVAGLLSVMELSKPSGRSSPVLWALLFVSLGVALLAWPRVWPTV